MIIDLSARLRLPDGMRLVATAIRPADSRREAETAAVDRLIKYLFGSDVKHTHRADGSPVIDGVGSEISVSHSRTHAFVATHTHLRIGVDAEQPRNQLMTVASKFMSAEELTTPLSLDQLLTAWTIKEAVYKAAGTPGLSLTDIKLPIRNKMASTVSGRRFRLFTARTANHTVTVAIPH